MSELTKFRFPTKKDKDFISTLRRRVNEYFAQNNISKNANSRIFVKTAVMYALYLLPFAGLFLLSGAGYWVQLLLWGLMGLGAAGIGANIMHDAMHNATFASERANKLMGLCMNIIGGHAPSWHLQHNVLHHAYTNIDGADLDIDGPPLLRFSPHQKKRKVHKYQHIYAWPLYSLMTLFRTFLTDFTNLWQFRSRNSTVCCSTW
jgi:linoleoyl-CoA desaturase